MSDASRPPTDIRLEWSSSPIVVLAIRHGMRALTGAELRTIASIVDQIDDFRAEVADPLVSR